MLIIKCTKCKNRMKCEPRKGIQQAKKKCVYCGKNLRVKELIVRKNTLAETPKFGMYKPSPGLF